LSYQYGDDVISDRVNGRSQAAVCKKADLHKPKRIQKSKLHTEADSRSELHTEADWKRIGSGLEADWKRIGSGLEADWKRIGSGLEADWKRIGSGLRANSIGDIDMRHTTYDASLRNGHFFFGCLAREKNKFKKAPHILHQHRQHYPRQSTKQHLSPASASWKV
jgi:hypothetical protein